jgi:hypothetical protein
MLSPAAARNRKRLPVRVTLYFSDGRVMPVPTPSTQAWLQYAKNQGADPQENPVVFYDNKTKMVVTKGAKR